MISHDNRIVELDSMNKMLIRMSVTGGFKRYESFRPITGASSLFDL